MEGAAGRSSAPPPAPATAGRPALSLRSRLPALLLLALLMTGLNALKPLHADDDAFYHYARQIARQPFDPYGFELTWLDPPRPANDDLAPPVLPYWWALGIHLFGEQPLLWKLWLLPFSLTLVFSLDGLFRRFAPGLEWPLTCMTALSPGTLPGFNLMLDVPALALGMGAVLLFLKALDRNDRRGILLAGLVAGIAAQTKYTAWSAPLVMLVAAGQARRLPLGLLAGATASAVFCAWEAFTWARYGASHLAANLSLLDGGPGMGFALKMTSLLPALATTTGAVGAPVVFLGLWAHGVPARLLLLGGAVIALAFAMLTMSPERTGVSAPGPIRLTAPRLVYGLLGAASLGVVVALLRRAYEEGRPGRWNRPAALLAAWLLIELLIHFVMTPWPAARRVLGITLAATLLSGALLSAAGDVRRREGPVRCIAAGGILLGLLFYAVDLLEARACRQAVTRALELVRPGPRSQVWFVGNWGFHFYAVQAGLRPAVPGRTRLERNDWLLVAEDTGGEGPQQANPRLLRAAGTFAVDDSLRLATWPNYYAGSLPLLPRARPRFRARLYRVERQHTHGWGGRLSAAKGMEAGR